MTRTRLALVVAATTGTVALSAGCAAGGGAATLQIQPNFAAGQTHDILAQNIVVVVDPKTGAAQLTGTVVNTGDAADRLIGVSIDGKSVPLASIVDIFGKSSVNLAAARGQKFVVANGSGAQPGLDSQVDLTFSTSGSLSLSAQTEPNTGIYAQFQPSAANHAS